MLQAGQVELVGRAEDGHQAAQRRRVEHDLQGAGEEPEGKGREDRERGGVA